MLVRGVRYGAEAVYLSSSRQPEIKANNIETRGSKAHSANEPPNIELPKRLKI